VFGLLGQMMLYNLYVPLNGNDGRPFAPELWGELWDELAGFAGGCTVLPAADGRWIDGNGMIRREPVFCVLVALPAGREGETFLSRLVQELAARLQQEEIFVYAHPICVSGQTLARAVTAADSEEATIPVREFRARAVQVLGR
jgi:hypothetical protein